MRIRARGVKYFIPNDHPYAMAIEDLAKGYILKKGTGPNGEQPERNDVKQLWRELSPQHKALLVAVATRAGGCSQADLEAALRIDWKRLRGTHNGLARICERLEIEKPVRATGYNSSNRTYLMDPDAAYTVRNLNKRNKA